MLQQDPLKERSFSSVDHPYIFDPRCRLAVTMDVPTKLLMEEFANDMVQRSRLAVTKDVPTKLSREEYAVGMGQSK